MTSIGIFQGKRAEYNKSILETLFLEGPLTSWELAKSICYVRKPKLEKDQAHYKAQKIYAVIARKKVGRLPELEAKQYIELNSGKWQLTLKGLLAFLIEKPALNSQLHPEYSREPLTLNVPRKMKLFGAEIDGKVLQRFASRVQRLTDDPRTRLFLAKKLEQLLNEGIDLDKINTERLGLLLSRESVALVNKLFDDAAQLGKLLRVDPGSS